MPIYEFSCKKCGVLKEIVCSINEIPAYMECDICGSNAMRKYSFNIGNKEYAKPLVSDSLAMNPNQIPEHRKLFPNIKVLPDGRPVFTDFKQHDEYLKKTGFVKNPKRSKKHAAINWT